MENVESPLGFIYIIQEREFLNAHLNIYKIGYSESIARRLPEYPKGSELKFCVQTQNFVAFERDVIKLFDVKFILRRDIGREYYEGDLCDMITSIAFMVKKHNQPDVEVDNVAKAKEDECIRKEDEIKNFFHHYIDTVGVCHDLKEYSTSDFYNLFTNWKGETLVTKNFLRKYINKIGRWNGVCISMKGRQEIYTIQYQSLKDWLDFQNKHHEVVTE